MRPNLKPLSDQVIVITGGSSGIGLTTAQMAAERGAAVMIASRNEDALKDAVEDIKAKGGRADYVVGDVGVEEDVRHLADETIARFGRFDTWVNDAGIGLYQRLEELEDDEHRRLFDTNYWGVVHGSQAAVQHFRDRGDGGALINIGSILSDMSAPLLSAYSASKHAVKGYTDALRMEVYEQNEPISVTLIKPSSINTPFPRHAKNELDSEARVPPPVYQPEAVAAAILYAAENPARDLVVGGAGPVMTAFANWFPRIADRFYAKVMSRMQKTGRPKSLRNNLFQAGPDGDTHGGHSFTQPVSPYTHMQLHPRAVLAAGAVAGMAAGAWLLKHNDKHRKRWF